MKLSLLLPSVAMSLFPLLATSHAIRASNRICKDYSIPLDITSPVFTPVFPKFEDSFGVADFINSINRRDAAISFNPFESNITHDVNASYNIAATVCSPVKVIAKEKTLLLATHGLGFDRKYWDSGFEAGNYNFVDFAISKGYSVFFYDRLGTGLSSKVSGYNESQALTQLVILQQLTLLLKSGKYTGGLGVPSKIVHIGHSFGSFLSNALLVTSPSLSDGAVLTGLGYYAGGASLEAWSARIASQLSPGKWPGRDLHYVTWIDALANAATFFFGDSYSKKALAYAESMKQPIAAIEILTLQTLPLNATHFSGPVMTLSGEKDFIVCGGNCVGMIGPENKQLFFENSSDFQGVVHPGAGHAINFSYNATGAYEVITDFLGKNGL